MTLSTSIFAAGICHFGILIASALVPKVLDWRHQLQTLTPLCRHLVWTHGAFIVLVIIGFGALSVGLATDLAAGTTLARCLCGFIGIFWLTRLIIQLFLFDARPYLSSRFLKVGYHALTIVFTGLAGTYLYTALAPHP